MTLFQTIRGLLDRYESRGLEPSELTALLPLRSEPAAAHEELLATLRKLDSAEPSPLWAASSMHQARFIVLEQAKLARAEAENDFPFGPLLFNFVCDGDVEDALYELFERCGDALDPVLSHCAGYPGASDRPGCVQLLLAARVPSQMFYSDGAASRVEIVRALELRRRFVDFVMHQQRASDTELFRAFERFRVGRWPEGPAKTKAGRVRARASAARSNPPVPANDTVGARLDYGLPLLRPFERPLTGEQYWVRRLSELERTRARRQKRAEPAKSEAPTVLRATFVVRTDLPSELQHGVFVPGTRYAAWLRLGGETAAAPGGGGELAIKLERVAGHGHLLDLGLPEATPAGCQDFVLSHAPTFFARDIRDYTVLQSIQEIRDPAERARRLAVFALRRPRESLIFARRWLEARMESPLEGEYHSATASALGPQLAVKYCVTPAQPTAADATEDASEPGEPLERRLDPQHGHALELEFYAIVPSRDVLPVEDPRVDWEAAGGKRVRVATLEIEPQDLRSPERLRVAESLRFTPWHTLEAHRPLGGLNRARLELERAQAEAAAAISGSQRPRAETAAATPRRTRPPSVRAGGERWSSAPHVRSRSSAPPADRSRAPKSVRPPARRKRNRSVH